MSKQERYAGASVLQGLSLGQQSAYISQYTPSLLQPVPRSLNRDDLGPVSYTHLTLPTKA